MPPTADIDDLRLKLTHAEAMIADLRVVVADLRTQIDARQAHIHRLVTMTFGRGGERVEGPTLFDGFDPEPDPTPVLVVEAAPEVDHGEIVVCNYEFQSTPTPKGERHAGRPRRGTSANASFNRA